MGKKKTVAEATAFLAFSLLTIKQL